MASSLQTRTRQSESHQTEDKEEELNELIRDYHVVTEGEQELYNQHKDAGKLRLTQETMSKLKSGDVVELSYYKLVHFVVVEGVRTQPDSAADLVIIDAIHYGRPDLLTPNRIIREKFELRLNTDKCWLHVFPPASCYPSQTVLQRARSRLNEDEHSGISNNATMFALWCKVESPTHRSNCQVPIYISDRHHTHVVKVGDHIDIECMGRNIHAEITGIETTLDNMTVATIIAKKPRSWFIPYVHDSEHVLTEPVSRVISMPAQCAVGASEITRRAQQLSQLFYPIGPSSLSVCMLFLNSDLGDDDWMRVALQGPAEKKHATKKLMRKENPKFLKAGDIIYLNDVYRLVIDVGHNESGTLIRTVQYCAGPDAIDESKLIELKCCIQRQEKDIKLCVHNEVHLDCELYGGGREKPTYSAVKVTNVDQLQIGSVISFRNEYAFFKHAVIVKTFPEVKSSTTTAATEYNIRLKETASSDGPQQLDGSKRRTAVANVTQQAVEGVQSSFLASPVGCLQREQQNLHLQTVAPSSADVACQTHQDGVVSYQDGDSPLADLRNGSLQAGVSTRSEVETIQTTLVCKVVTYVMSPSLSSQQFEVAPLCIEIDIDEQSKQNVHRIHYDIDASRKFSPDKVIERALSRLGEREHNLLWNSDRDFARWCSIEHGSNREQCRIGINSAKDLVHFERGHIKFLKCPNFYTHDAIMRECSVLEDCEEIVNVRLYENNHQFRSVRKEVLHITDEETVLRVIYDGFSRSESCMSDSDILDQLMGVTFLDADDDRFGWTNKETKCGSRVTSHDFCHWLKAKRRAEGLGDIQKLFGAQLDSIQKDVSMLDEFGTLSSSPGENIEFEHEVELSSLRQFDHIVLDRKVQGQDTKVHFILVEWDAESSTGVGVTYEAPPEEVKMGFNEFKGFLRVAGPGQLQKVVHNTYLDWQKIDAKFEDCQGARNYRLLFNNCEHFVNFLIYGRFTSLQLSDWALRATSACPSFAVSFFKGIGKFAKLINRVLQFFTDISPAVPDGKTFWAEGLGLVFIVGFSVLEALVLNFRKASTGMPNHEYRQRLVCLWSSLGSTVLGLLSAIGIGTTACLPLLGVAIGSTGIGFLAPRIPAIVESMRKP